MSENAHTAVMAFPEFIIECRGNIYVKVTLSRLNKITQLPVMGKS